MRMATIVLGLAAIVATSPALAQARLLTTPEQAPPQAGEQAPPTKTETQVPAEAPAGKPAKAQNRLTSEPPRIDSEVPQLPGRYDFNRVDNGLVRLDRASGEVAFCRSNATGWVCQAVPEERAALQNEIDRLRAEVASLKKEIASMREQPPPPLPPQTVPPAPRPDKGGDIQTKLSAIKDIARVFIANTWHRLVEMIENWQKDLGRT
jgi:hypothetical protein